MNTVSETTNAPIATSSIPWNEKRIFCLRGHMKSGTNWACRLLNLHPHILCRGEFHWERYFKVYTDSVEQRAFIRRKEEQQPVIATELSEFIKRSMQKLASAKAQFFGDRTPHTIEPVAVHGAPHISMVRDLRDVLVSKAFHMFNRAGLLDSHPEDSPMRKLARLHAEDPWYFREFPGQLLADRAFVRNTCKTWVHFMKQDREAIGRHPDTPVMFVKYEDLHANVELLRKKMYEFIGADPQLAEPIPSELMPGHEVEKPDQFNRKGQVGDWQNYVTPQVREWINEIASEELQRQGYIDSTDWEISLS